MDLTAFAELIATVPESIWGAITGSALTLIGVWMTNRHNLKQQRQKFEFESREKQRERKVNLRRDVYLPTADAVAAIVSALSKMLGSDGAENDDNLNRSSQAFGAALTRVQMVASAETIKCAAGYQRAFLSGFSALQRLRYPMMLRRADIQIAHNKQQSSHEERMKCVELMKEYNLAGVHNPQRWQAIQRQSLSASKQWNEANSEWMRLVLRQETDRLALTRELATRVTELVKTQGPLLAAIRSELESSGESALIAEETEKTAAVGLNMINDLIPLIEASLEGLRRDVEADEERRRTARPPDLE